MWRALFYAVGIMTILLGVQSLVFEQVQLAPGKDALQIVKRLLRDDNAGPIAVRPETGNFAVRSNNGQRVFQSASDSTFGPSRFPSGGFGGTTFSAAPYRDLTQSGGLAVRSGQASNVPPADFASYQTRSQRTGSGVAGLTQTAGRVIQSKDWMPWSLLAIGTVIVLYTRSFGARSL
jgi:hypothetical protein